MKLPRLLASSVSLFIVTGQAVAFSSDTTLLDQQELINPKSDQEVQTEFNSSNFLQENEQQLRTCKGLGCGRIRPMSDTNPFGIDLGWGGGFSYSGVPSRALAMLKAQLEFAKENCPKPNSLRKTIFMTQYIGIYGAITNPDYMRPFREAVDKAKDNYRQGWQGLDEPRRELFCTSYLADTQFDATSFKLMPSEFYVKHLSPLSDHGIAQFETRLKRAEKIKWLAIFAQTVTLAAQTSAGHDAIKTGKAALREGEQGNIGAMNSQMLESRALFSQSSNFANIGSYFGAMGAALSTKSVEDPQIQEDSFSPNCNTLNHFTKWDAPADSEVWKGYQRITADCDALFETLGK